MLQMTLHQSPITMDQAASLGEGKKKVDCLLSTYPPNEYRLLASEYLVCP